MNQQIAQQICERLCALEELGRTLVKQGTHTNKLLREVKKAMAITQADIDALTQRVSDINTAVVAQGVEIAKIGADITALGTTPNLTVDALQEAILGLGNRVTDAGVALQNVDDLVPEQPAP